MKELNVDGLDRIYLYRILPANVGSLEESLLTKDLRDRIINEDFQNSVNWSEQMGQLNFNVVEARKYPSKTFQLDDAECKVIAYGFLHDEQNGEVPTDERYLKLYQEFKPYVEEINS